LFIKNFVSGWLLQYLCAMIDKLFTRFRWVRKYAYWIILIGGALVFMYTEDEAIEPYYSFSVFIYCVFMIFWAIRWIIKQRRELLALKTIQQHTELQHLKSQVNPHFFFNMLNNLYGTVDSDPQKAKNLILKLSDLMRYSIYEGENKRVAIQEEIDYIHTFIELHKMRYRKQIDIKIVLGVDDPEFEIMPLMFINLIENAFKHGVENLRKDAFVHIQLALIEGDLRLEVRNNFDAALLSEKSGIGLKNLRRRLQLEYPKRHHLAFEVHNNEYTATLNIQHP
jgi:LytS/YehU family sensor histidine kinase